MEPFSKCFLDLPGLPRTSHIELSSASIFMGSPGILAFLELA